METSRDATELPNELGDLLAGRQLIIASSRGPYTFVPRPDGRLAITRCGGGLVTAMMCVAEASGARWICAASSPHDRAMAQRDPRVGLPPGHPRFEMILVPIAEDVYEQFYGTIANPLLWFIHHYLWDLTHEPSFDETTHAAWARGYAAFNELLADAIADECRTAHDPLVMIQDYHLFLCPTMVRARGCTAPLIHFTHVPWPQPDYFRILPAYMRRQILEGLLAADIVGFHTQRYVENFLWTCKQVGGYEVDFDTGRVLTPEHVAQVCAYPISISPESIGEAARAPDVEEHLDELKQVAGDAAVVVRVDRADPAKNALRGFDAFRALLVAHPELAGRVRFLSMLYPTRTQIPHYRSYLAEIQERVRAINDEFGYEGWQPVHLRVADDYAESLAALRLYDVLLVNPVLDGMNLIAKEGPRVNERNGVLILSENAGAFHEVSDACLAINPFDSRETAEAIYEALTMDARERAQRGARLREIVGRNDSVKWLYHQLKDADALAARNSSRNDSTTSAGPRT